MILSRYLTREIVMVTLVITLFLLLAFLCQQGLRYLNYVAMGKVPGKVLLLILGFEIPYLLAILTPLGLFLGILLVLGRLHIDHEMAILKMCGFGQLRLMYLISGFALCVTLLVLFLMAWVNPILSAKREQMTKVENASQYLMQTIMPGRFQVSPDGRYVMYVGALSRDRKWVKNVFLAQGQGTKQENNPFHWRLIDGQEGYLEPDKTKENDIFFILRNGYRYDGIPGQNDFKIVQFEKYAIRIPSETSNNNHQPNEALSTLKLFSLYQSPQKAAELQWRLSIPLSALLLALLAVALSALHRGKSQFVMLIPAILFYIIYMNLLFIARRWLDGGLIPIGLGMWWVHGVLLLTITLIVFLHKKNWI